MISRVLLLCLVLGLVSSPAHPQLIPETTQLPIYFKLLTYNRTLWVDRTEPLRIGLLQRRNSHESRDNHDAMLEALSASTDKTINGLGFDFATLSWDADGQLAEVIETANVDVIYVTAGHDDQLDTIARSCRAAGLLSMAGREGYVARGLSVGLELDGERPRIEVNLEALAAEGHQLDSRVLRLCKVVHR